MKTCPWWIRWWHRRLRKFDERFLLTSLVKASLRYGDTADSPIVTAAWEKFKSEEGQEHWRCRCAAADLKAKGQGQ